MGFQLKSDKDVIRARKGMTDNRVLDFVVMTIQPISVVDDPSFRSLLSSASAGSYTPMCRQTLRTQISEKRERMEEDVKNALHDVEYVGLLTDTWTADYFNTNHCAWVASIPNSKSDKEFLTFFTLGMPKIPYNHDAEGLRASMKEICERYAEQHKTVGVVSDSAQVNVSVFDTIHGILWYVR